MKTHEFDGKLKPPYTACMSEPMSHPATPPAREAFTTARAAALNAARDIRNLDNEFLRENPDLAGEGFSFHPPESVGAGDAAQVRALTQFYLKMLTTRDVAP